MLTGLPKNGDFRHISGSADRKKIFHEKRNTIAVYIQLIRIFEQKITKN